MTPIMATTPRRMEQVFLREHCLWPTIWPYIVEGELIGHGVEYDNHAGLQVQVDNLLVGIGAARASVGSRRRLRARRMVTGGKGDNR
jgi:hypothetical protein